MGKKLCKGDQNKKRKEKKSLLCCSHNYMKANVSGSPCYVSFRLKPMFIALIDE
jgi:hypothetical protein